MTYTMLTLIMVLIIIVVAVSVYFIKQEIEKQKMESIRTEILQIQGKIKVIADSSTAKKDENLLKGKKLSENVEAYQGLIDQGIIAKEDENLKKNYILDKTILVEMGIPIKNLGKAESMIVNYETEEIILTTPIIIENNSFYKLSEIEKYIEEKQNKVENKQEENKETTQDEAVSSEKTTQ